MQGYNVILLFSEDTERILLCKRKKNPYIGLNNLVGGKIELNEGGLEAAYRELFEETAVSKSDVKLRHLMDFKYYFQNCYVEVYAGKLIREVFVNGDENDLFWSDLSHIFFDMKQYAGEGNIGHMIEQVKMCADKIFADDYRTG